MKTFYKWFNLLVITFLIIVPFFTFIPHVYLIEKKFITNDTLISDLDSFYNTLFLLNYIVGVPYVIVGAVLLLKAVLQKKKKATAVKIFTKGVFILIVPAAVIFTCEALSFCGIAL